MRPEKIGRVLGVGLRVAGRMASQRMSGGTSAGAPVSAAGPGAASAYNAGQSPAQAAGRTGQGVARGVGGFLRPFQRVGGILWLEVTGVFFFLPVLVFGPTLWRTRQSYAHGADHRTFVASAIVVVVFFYLAVSSFWRARRK